MRTFPYCFGKPPAANQPRNPELLKLFDASCVKCGTASVKFVSEFDDESGETAVYLFCTKCRVRERLKF
jgi:hypothetical protein